uniref:DUF4283 domain-containing protein n=1 Tax=Tanacetum cinerariifolium TaxID=118510 RepID=A0A6L2L8T0_TANCI|nr:hypothetical protein [Tanacetum cinerariifolium]
MALGLVGLSWEIEEKGGFSWVEGMWVRACDMEWTCHGFVRGVVRNTRTRNRERRVGTHGIRSRSTRNVEGSVLALFRFFHDLLDSFQLIIWQVKASAFNSNPNPKGFLCGNGAWFLKPKSENGLSAIATKLGTPLMLDSYTSDMCMQSWGRLSYARVMIQLQADVELKHNIVVAMLKIIREGHYICKVRVEYEWKPPRCASCKVFRHIHEECSKNICVGEKKTLRKPSQTSRVFCNKKKGVVPTIEVEFADDYDSEDDVALVGNDMAHSMASERVGFGTQSLLEQWRDSYGNGDYDDDPYDDDMYEGQDLPQELQAICDNLDIRVRGRNKE